MVKAAYIHIPFCEHICHYCDFNKVFLKNQPVDDYIESLLMEMELATQRTLPDRLETIYIGGGTPTALTAKQLQTLFEGMAQIFPLEQVKEFTVEVNPDSSELDKLNVMKNAGVNRLSIGVQTFEQDLLKGIGRTHSRKSVEESIERSRKVGFKNISIDLMFGLPHQKPDHFEQTLKEAIALNVDHISAYSLKVEEKTVFYNQLRKGKLSLPPEDDEVKMYNLLRTKLAKAGFTHYEISNFAKPGFESKHNLVYWNNEEYYGFGAGAHGYVQGVRNQNYGPVPKYIQAIKKYELPYLHEHNVTVVERIEEAMFMGLRKRKGISIEQFKKSYHCNPEELYQHQIDKLIERGLLEKKQGWIRLTNEGLLLGNEVFEQFIAVLEEGHIV
ncbi:radical SAM family heme chaperone HemW [Halalkalibacter urbisdiaboli]|uniref:radical SAM family heme chaperone HemW n=1 Tax=Halalkalibacter urbisdiaboli TaxID=1960589 RepID=UPI000B434544|nr:radical SAM family heme chaperone HemW [Halalkalibacter urbisdiaboli]